MQKSILFVANDPMGAAIYDYHKNGKAGKLRVFSSCMEEDEIPVAELFRTFSEMPSLEQIALEMATGKILDVGGGSGCHSLALKEMGKETMAIDISPLAVEVMRERGINAKVTNFYDENFSEKFDTILLLMNGSGIIGNIKNMEHFFSRIRTLLNPGGCVFMDSSDLRYLFEEEDGSFSINLADEYYGQFDYQMQYKEIKGQSFDWLYIDFDTLSFYAEKYGFCVELAASGNHYDYLAKLAPIENR